MVAVSMDVHTLMLGESCRYCKKFYHNCAILRYVLSFYMEANPAAGLSRNNTAAEFAFEEIVYLLANPFDPPTDYGPLRCGGFVL